MSSYFYLSYAAADNSELLEKFFKDLSVAVRASLLLSGDEQVGFFDPSELTDADAGPTEIAGALRTSQTMIALISPRYFQSEQAGKEWQIFEMRRRLKTESLRAPELRPPAIIPVIWIPCDDPVRTVMEQAQFGWDKSYKIYRLNGLIGLMTLGGSLPSFADEYVKVLVTLAEQIIKLARTSELPALDALHPLNAVRNAFITSQAATDFTEESEQQQKPKVAIVEDNQQVREMLFHYLSGRGYDCKPYWWAELALIDIASCQHQIRTFDVVLVDLELEQNRMQGLNLIERLAGDDDSPPIIAMSAGLSNSEYIQALKVGADDVIPKPFDLRQIRQRVRNLARIGQKRRQYRRQHKEGPISELQDKRRKRRVFLSYSNIDGRTATILRTQIEARGIGVWYAPDSLALGDPIMKGIMSGLDTAEVFVPLVTDNYSRSAWCAFEMAWCKHRPGAIVIPVLEGYLHRIRNRELLRPIMDDNDHADITCDRFADGITLLLGRIQQAVAKNKKTHVGSNSSL